MQLRTCALLGKVACPLRAAILRCTQYSRKVRRVGRADARAQKPLHSLRDCLVTLQFLEKSLKVLFVCLGNICRSPTAEGVFRNYVKQAGLDGKVTIDSAGTADWHTGKAPDPRTIKAAARRGYDLSVLRARQAVAEDFHRFDLILAMDESNLANLKAIQPADGKAELALYLPRVGLEAREVPDPYYGGEEGFERVLDVLEQASDALLNEVRSSL